MAEKRQMANLWGRAIGQLNQKIVDVKFNLDNNTSPPSFEIEIEETTNTAQIPLNAEIRVMIRRGLRKQRYDCGTMGEPHLPVEETISSNQITLFGDEIGPEKWDVKFVNPTEPGRVFAWTEPTRCVPREPIMKDDHGHALLQVGMDDNEILTSEAFGMSFEDSNPAIIVNKDAPQLLDELKNLNTHSLLMMPEIFGSIIDKLLEEHCDNPIGPGSSTWQERWLTWIYGRVESILPPIISSADDFKLCMEWKEECVKMVKNIINQARDWAEKFDGGNENDN